MNYPTLLLLGLSACGLPVSDPPPPDPPNLCQQPAPDAVSWSNGLRTRGILLLGGPVHAGVDAIARPGELAVVEGKFSYGPTSADLEGELVEAYWQPDGCEWVSLGRGTTDSDGRVRFTLTAPDPGHYEVLFVVLGDGSETRAALNVLPEEQRIVVFDIDGTLTTSDAELVDGIVLHHVGASSDTLFDLAGSPLTRAQWLTALDQVLDEDAEIWEGAVDVVQHYAELGIQPVYITGRPYLYDAMTRRWMDAHGLPDGPLLMVQNFEEAMPSNVAAFKQRHLDSLQMSGHEIVAAYGNAHSDICAYQAAGIPAEASFIIGPNAGASCEGGPATRPVTSYPEHLDTL